MLKLILIAAVFLVTGLVGSTRRLGFFMTLLLSFVLTPLGGFLAAALSGPRKRKEPGQGWWARRRARRARRRGEEPEPDTESTS